MEPLGAYFDKLSETRRKHGGLNCPGEEECEEQGTPHGKQGLRNKSRSIEAICGKCELRHTKPGSAPDHLVPLIVTAHRMEALFEHGAGAPYPQVFTSLEWEAFLALLYSRAKDQEKAMPKQQRQQPSAQSNLSAELAKNLGARIHRK